MATIIGTPNSETLIGTEFADSAVGAGGNDVLNGLAGDDTLDGGTDNDTQRGGDGNDTLLGGAGKDWLYGDGGDDRLFGGGRVDRLIGGDGNDLLDGGSADDRLVGGKGDDVYVVDSLLDQTTELTGEGTDEVRTSLLSFTLGSFVENLSFTGSGNFAGTGNGGANRIAGGSGNDVLDGAVGNDLLFGGSGRDTLTGADGNDVLDGGTGRDALPGGAGGDTLFGRDFNDVLTGGAGDDVVDGGLGTDTARFSGLKSDYQIRRVDDKIEVVDLNATDGDDGTDLLSSVEVLQFKDGTLPPPTAIAAIRLAELEGTNGCILQGFYSGDQLGWSGSGAGDINGDGFDDLIVGEPSAKISGEGGEYYYTGGRSYIVFGRASWVTFPDFDVVLYNNEHYSRTGFSVSNAGDVNGDGFADVIVGAPGEYSPYGGDPIGQAYVVFGKANWAAADLVDLPALDGSNGFQIKSDGFYDFAGLSVSSAGDINGDGFDDLIVGAPNGDVIQDEGISFVVFGKADWSGTPVLETAVLNGSNGFRLIGIDDDDRSGVSVASAGDLNGDGLDDLIIGAPDAGPGGASGSAPGEAYVVFGKTDWTGTPAVDLESLDGTNGFRITGEAGDLIGQSVHAAGDVNGDGITDIIVGAPAAESGAEDRTGESYVIFGKASWAATPVLDVASLDGNNGFRLIGADADGRSGRSVSSAGDVNGDGIDDLVIGAPYAGSGGNAYVVYGKANWTGTPALDLGALDGTNGFVLIGGDGPYDRTGLSVSSAGDVNKDGFDDLIIGAPGADGGRSYVVFGGNFNGAATVQVASAADELSMP